MQAAKPVVSWATQTAGTREARDSNPLFVVVGFDGSDPATRALDDAASKVQGRDGGLEVVYVVDPADDSPADMNNRPKEYSSRLARAVRERLSPDEQRWVFRKREGSVAGQLIAAAEEVERRIGSKASVVLEVGESEHHQSGAPGSLISELQNSGSFPVVVVP